MDFTNKLIGGNSPYIQSLNYNLSKREIVIHLLSSADSSTVSLVVTFPKITEFKESLEEIDDQLVDSIIWINYLSQNQVCIKTELREIMFSMDGVPHAEKVT
ncbi:hypothetical protein [Alteromonas sp. 009811495]|uniref:hypothetical protein n=1 Tax=Alteromonas sp. 009811495 TaxID=3002962 RepID=UPI00237DED55|nr:hypothetical protein [Alteromonas sp. 009811495]WDT86638.1 hypothetical protein OZ660_02505 [Alteromonas sp. 009811495]